MSTRNGAVVRLSFCRRLFAAWFAAVILAAPARAADNMTLPDNLARSAHADATSEHNASYLAKFASDGKIPLPGSTSADLNAAWCVLKAKTGDAADLTLTWNQPVDVAEIVYFGRTSWFMNECFKDYEVYVDEAAQPAAKGMLEMLHGPQRIALPPAKARKVTIKFLNSYGGFNPGAAEIMVFGQKLSRQQVALLQRLSGAVEIAGADQVAPHSLRELIQWLEKTHGPAYAQADEHLARLAALESRASSSSRDSRAASHWPACNARRCCSTSTGCWSSNATRSTPRTSTRITTKASRTAADCTSCGCTNRTRRPPNWSPRRTGRFWTATCRTTAPKCCSVGGGKRATGITCGP
ncbi:MAG TPA: discoidin domain-containing protein [Candidatus Anammoximicrobium sp.]|nr:discoidin domain-containing protein [Candidatus Anammoximicrobium sp.]